jgi:hypothetical protein
MPCCPAAFLFKAAILSFAFLGLLLLLLIFVCGVISSVYSASIKSSFYLNSFYIWCESGCERGCDGGAKGVRMSFRDIVRTDHGFSGGLGMAFLDPFGKVHIRLKSSPDTVPSVPLVQAEFVKLSLVAMVQPVPQRRFRDHVRFFAFVGRAVTRHQCPK